MEHSDNIICKDIIVVNEYGLHARPAGKLAQEAQKFKSDIVLISGELRVDAKSIVDILTLAAEKGTVLTVKAQGEDAESAVQSLEQLFQNRFEEV